MDLMSVYNNLKREEDEQVEIVNQPRMNPNAQLDPGMRREIDKMGDQHREHVCKRILLDIYCRIIPLDKSYIDGHRGELQGDIQKFLDKKGTTALQYIVDSRNKTSAPLMDYLTTAANNSKQEFVQTTTEEMNRDLKETGKLPTLRAVGPDFSIENELEDIKDDPEYQAFVSKLKEKTSETVVKDVTNVLEKEAQGKDLKFNPTTEDSIIEQSMRFMNVKLIQENVDVNKEIEEKMIGYAIRESTLNTIDKVFNHPPRSKGSISLNHGYIVNTDTLKQIQ